MLRYIERSVSGCTGMYASITAELKEGLVEGTKPKHLCGLLTLFSHIKMFRKITLFFALQHHCKLTR